jgi:O-antigen/teichoic acid export membrane protein
MTTTKQTADTAPEQAPGKGPGSGSGNEGIEAGRGALFIGFAKLYFMFTGSLQRFALPHVIGDAAAFGAFGVVNNLISIVNNTVVQATIPAISKFTAEDERRADAVKRAGLRMQLVVGGIPALIFFLGAPLLARFEKAPDYVGYFRIAAAIPFLYALYALFVGSANGLRRFRTQATFDVSFSTVKTVLLLGLAVAWGVSGAFLGFAAAAVVILIIAARVMGVPRQKARADEPTVSAWRLGGFMGAMVAYTLLLNLALNYDQPLLRRLAGDVVDGHRAGILAGHYDGLRTVALLPYQALLVITFVVFPLVSRSTFINDREATRTYVNQTLRYALMLVAAMGVCLAARPGTLLAIAYPRDYSEGAAALPVLVLGECCLAMLAVACAILNAAGRATAAIVLMAITVGVGVGSAYVLVPQASPGPAMLMAQATATAIGAGAGFIGVIVYLRRGLGGGLPPTSALRVVVSAALAATVGHFLPAHGKILGLLAIAAVGAIYLGGLLATGELGAADRAKLARILRRR